MLAPAELCNCYVTVTVMCNLTVWKWTILTVRKTLEWCITSAPPLPFDHSYWVINSKIFFRCLGQALNIICYVSNENNELFLNIVKKVPLCKDIRPYVFFLEYTLSTLKFILAQAKILSQIIYWEAFRDLTSPADSFEISSYLTNCSIYILLRISTPSFLRLSLSPLLGYPTPPP